MPGLALTRGPFADLHGGRRRRAMQLLGAGAAAQLAVFSKFEWRMKRTGGPGIIPFELAGEARSATILRTWGEDGRAAARASMRLDMVFPATYAPLQALACEAAADQLASSGHRALAAAGPVIAWSQLAAAGFDYVENVALLVVLSGPDRPGAQLARRAALTKFALLAPGWAYLAAAALSTR